MTVEQKKALLGEMPGFLQGAQIGQFNMFVESGAKVVYNEYVAQEEKKKGDMDPAAKDAIMDYVKRLMPIVREQYQGMYENMWLGILELKEVKLQVYNKGKQQDTTFNRNFVAQIIHQLGSRIYVPDANAVVMAEHLEPGKGKDHPVRQKLGEMPEKVVIKAVEELIKDKI